MGWSLGLVVGGALLQGKQGLVLVLETAKMVGEETEVVFKDTGRGVCMGVTVAGVGDRGRRMTT